MYESVAALQRKKFGEYFTKLGLQCGFWLALLYAILLALVFPSLDSESITAEGAGGVYLFVLLYGVAIGVPVGLIGGVVDGWLLGWLLPRVTPYMKGQAWLTGLLVCAASWLPVYWWFWPRPDAWEPLWVFMIFVGWPTMVHLCAGALLSQYAYQQFCANALNDTQITRWLRNITAVAFAASLIVAVIRRIVLA